MLKSDHTSSFPKLAIYLSAFVLMVLGADVAYPESDHTGAAPLIVLPALVVRCDTTADEPPFRIARPGYCVNNKGKSIAQATADPKVMALESVPELQWGAFDEYWRKMHGPKIIHVDGSEDQVTKLLVRYEQQHRIPGGPTSAFAPPYLAQVDADNLLVRDPHARIAGYKKPSFDGMAQLVYKTREDMDAFFGLSPGDKYLEKIVPDESVFIKGFAFNISKEFVLIADTGVRDPIILIKTLERGPQFSSRKAFQKLWLEEHSKLIRTGATRELVRRYAQLINISDPSDAPFYDPVGDRFDVIEVFSFANVNHLEEFLSGDGYAAVMADDERHTERTEIFTAVNYVITNQQQSEKPTRIDAFQ